MIAGAIAAPLFLIAIVAGIVAFVRIRSARPTPARMSQGAPFAIVMAAALGAAFCLFMFLAGTVLAIGVG